MGDCFPADLTDAERKELHALILARCVFHRDPSRETDCGVYSWGRVRTQKVSDFRVWAFGLVTLNPLLN